MRALKRFLKIFILTCGYWLLALSMTYCLSYAAHCGWLEAAGQGAYPQ